MEHTGVTPAGGVVAADLEPLLAGDHLVATLYLDTQPDVENAAHLSQARWKTVRARLEDAGADEAALAAIDPLVPDAHLQGACLIAVADADGLLHQSHLPDPPRRDLGRWAFLPSLCPVIEYRQSNPPHVVVLI